LGKQIGPLPLGAWVAVVGAGLGIAYYTRQQNSSEPIQVTDTSGDPGVGEGAGGWQYIDPTNGGVQSGGTKSIETNEEWYREALNYLIAQGYNAAVADSALRKYLTGGALNTQENALIIIALQVKGALPSPLPPADSGPSTPGGGTTPVEPAYTGPARRKAFKKDNYARPALTSWEAVLLYYYDNVAPAGPLRRIQQQKLRIANQSINSNAKSDWLVPGSRVYLPTTL
jgi:hypothetical protein